MAVCLSAELNADTYFPGDTIRCKITLSNETPSAVNNSTYSLILSESNPPSRSSSFVTPPASPIPKEPATRSHTSFGSTQQVLFSSPTHTSTSSSASNKNELTPSTLGLLSNMYSNMQPHYTNTTIPLLHQQHSSSQESSPYSSPNVSPSRYTPLHPTPIHRF
jgi:hypothetical protein